MLRDFFMPSKDIEDFDAVFSSASDFKKSFPGAVFGAFRNQTPWIYKINKKLKKIRIELSTINPEIINLNHIKIWVKNTEENTVQLKASQFTCLSSSTSDNLPNPALCMNGDRHNTVSLHTKREKQPYWEINFHDEFDVTTLEIYNRKDQWGERSRSLIIKGFDDNYEQAFIYGRCLSDNIKDIYTDEFITALKTIENLALKDDDAYKNLKKAILRLTKVNKNLKQKAITKQNILENIMKIAQSIELCSNDFGTDTQNGLAITVPSKTQFLKVTTYHKNKPQLKALTLSSKEYLKEASLNQSHNTDYLFTQKVINNPLITDVHNNEFQLPNAEGSLDILITGDSVRDTSSAILREIAVSSDGISWSKIHDNLSQLQPYYSLLLILEWVFGKQLPKEFFSLIGTLIGTYRLKEKSLLLKSFPNNSEYKPAFVNSINDAGNKANFLPKVIMTKHGLNTPLSEKDPKQLLTFMKNFTSHMKDKLNLDVFPCYGTLLGMYRDNSFIPHDDDLDFAVLIDKPTNIDPIEYRDQLISQIVKSGVNCTPATETSYNVHVHMPGMAMDLFFIFVTDKTAICHMEQFKIREIPYDLLQPLSKITFLGEDFNAPANIEGFLLDRYGTGWSKPDPLYEI